MSTEAVQLTVNRLRAIRWRAHDEALEKAYSRAALMKEYFRRSALWLNSYGDTRRWPFFDLAAIVEPTVRADPAVITDIEAFIDDAADSSYAMDSGVAAVQWAALIDAPGLQLRPLPDPFEPLLRCYERGGSGFAFVNGYIDFGVIMVQRTPGGSICH